MTTKQDNLYWREWAAVRAAWPEADRHEVHIRALGVDKSHKFFSNRDFDRVLQEFRSISRPSDLSAQLRQLRQVRTRLMWKITIEQTGLLMVLMDGPNDTDRRAAAESYIITIMRDKFRTDDITSLKDRPAVAGAKSELEMLRDTIAARLNDLRRDRGITVHQLKELAGVWCDCRDCARRRRSSQPDQATQREAA